MGRKLKPDGLRRKTCTMSLPLDVIAYLDKMALQAGVARSRIIEGTVRDSMRKGQTTLSESRFIWWCPSCDERFTTSKESQVLKHSCGKWLDKPVHYRGIYEEE